MITVTLPQKVSTNAIYGGMHWAKRKKLADLFHESLIEYRNVRFKTPAHLTFTFSFKGRLLDVGNCSFMEKMLTDALVHWKIIPDDTPEYVASIKIQVLKGNKDMVVISE